MVEFISPTLSFLNDDAISAPCQWKQRQAGNKQALPEIILSQWKQDLR